MFGGKRFHRYTLAFLAATLLSGCEEFAEALAAAPRIELFRVEGSDEETDVWVVPVGMNTGGDPRELGDLAGELDGARYRLLEQHRAYLFTGDLREGIRSGSFLHLPWFDSSVAEPLPDRGEYPWIEVPLARSDGWSSFRVYDSGDCSVLVPWEEPPLDGILGDRIDSLLGLVVGSLDSAFAERNFTRMDTARVISVLRAARGAIGLTEDDDRIRFEGRYHGGDMHGCANLTLDVAVEFGFQRVPAIIEVSPACGDAGGVLVIDDGETFDVQGVVYDAWAEVVGDCGFEGEIENRVIGSMRRDLPELVRRAINDALLLNPNDLGFADSDIPSCSCDQDCNSFAPGGPVWPWGVRHRCKFPDGDPAPGTGECWIQIDPERVNVRPEGVEVIMMDEPEDPQRVVFSAETPSGPLLESLLCTGDRPISVAEPTAGTLGTFEVP